MTPKAIDLRYRALLGRLTWLLSRQLMALARQGRNVYGGDRVLWDAAIERLLGMREVPNAELEQMAQTALEATLARTSRQISQAGTLSGQVARGRAALMLPLTQDAQDLAAGWPARQAGRLAGLERAQGQRSARIIAEGWAKGVSVTAMAEQLREVTHSSLRRAELVSRYEVARLNSELARSRMQQAGVTHYRWSTAEDGRTRSNHAERHGRIFSWDEPPEGGHPGEAYGCRCVAIPVMEVPR